MSGVTLAPPCELDPAYVERWKHRVRASQALDEDLAELRSVFLDSGRPDDAAAALGQRAQTNDRALLLLVEAMGNRRPYIRYLAGECRCAANPDL